MNKVLTIIITLLISLSGSAQIEKGKVLLKTTLQFGKYDNFDEESMKNYGDNKLYNMSLGAESFLNNRWSLGLTLVYQKTSYKYQSFDNIEGVYNTQSSKTFIPQIHLNHYVPIFDKLYYFTNLTIGYAGVTEKWEYAYQVIQIGDNPPDADYHHDEYKYKYIMASLKPNLIYFLTNKLAVQSTFGGINYRKYLDSDNSDFSFSLNPSSWSFGLVLAL